MSVKDRSLAARGGGGMPPLADARSIRLRRSVLDVRTCVERGAPLGGRAGSQMADLDACPDGADHFGQTDDDGHDAHYQRECRDGGERHDNHHECPGAAI